VILHVGMGKTGTTTIQATFHRNRTRLAECGVFYPQTPGKRRHVRLALAMQPDVDRPRNSGDWRRQQVSTPAELRPAFEKSLISELRANPSPRVLFSEESLFRSEPDSLRNLRHLLDRVASSVRVVCYLRRQDDHVCSRYQQRVKFAGETSTLAARVTQLDLSHVYDYHAWLVAWRDVIRPDELVLRTFERDRFLHGSLLEDFLEAAGLDVALAELVEVPRKNESLDAESVEFLRIVNIFDRERGATPDFATRSAIVRRLVRASIPGPTLTLADDVLDPFMARWQESNRAVARDFAPLGPEDFFMSDRKTGNTTTEQCIDPDRLDHFVGLTGLPAEMVFPLRLIAEREAAGQA